MEFNSGNEGSERERQKQHTETAPSVCLEAYFEARKQVWGQTWGEAWGHAWGRTWLMEAWPRARAQRVVMGLEEEARQFSRPWAEEWTRAEAKVHAQARMYFSANAKVAQRLQMIALARDAVEALMLEAEARAHVDALQVAEVWARASGVKVLAVADPSRIWDTLSFLNRHQPAHGFWHHSPGKDEYPRIIHFIAPITRVPFELLRQIFLIIIDEASSPPPMLMLVCKHWYTIVTSLWASLILDRRTPLSAIARTLEKNQWLLDIVVDTDFDHGAFTSYGAFNALFAAIEVSSRWRSLVLKSVPGQADLSEDLVNCRLQRCSNATMNRFTTFKVKPACKTSPFLKGLLHILGTTAGSELTTMEINSANVISFLAPAYSSMFHSVKVLSLDTPGIPNPVDLLPYLHQLESFTASHICFPVYHNDTNLPFVHTLRHLRLKAVSIQWMSDRTFHVLEDCTIIFPLHRNVLHTFRTALPNCQQLTFQGYPLEILGGVMAHKLTRLSVTCSGTFNRRGSQQLVGFSCQVLRETRLSPQIFHISIGAISQAWISALTFMSDLEELVIESAEPSALGAEVFHSFIVRPDHASDTGAASTPKDKYAPLCPSLKRFGLKYRRWLRQSEQFNLTPDIVSIITSRENTIYALQSFSIWMTSNSKDPLELVKESQMSREGLERLASKSGIGGETFPRLPTETRGSRSKTGVRARRMSA